MNFITRQGGISMITERQKQVLKFIDEYKEKNDGMAPSVREIADSYNVTPGAAAQTLDALRRKGFVSYDRRPRSIKILKRA
jgi:SOS-response transcriptional repressor LexA